MQISPQPIPENRRQIQALHDVKQNQNEIIRTIEKPCPEPIIGHLYQIDGLATTGLYQWLSAVEHADDFHERKLKKGQDSWGD